jgi:putative transposase
MPGCGALHWSACVSRQVSMSPAWLCRREVPINAFSERRVRSAKPECRSKLVLFGGASLNPSVADFVEHYHDERNHQNKGNVLLFPKSRQTCAREAIKCTQRLGGWLKYYEAL